MVYMGKVIKNESKMKLFQNECMFIFIGRQINISDLCLVPDHENRKFI